MGSTFSQCMPGLRASHASFKRARPRSRQSEIAHRRLVREWSGTWSGETAIVGTCNDGAFLLMVDRGIGNADHMGRSTYLTTYCMDPSTWIGSGSGVGAAANGDELYFQLTLQITWTSATDGIWMQTETVTGGTGRFVDATGNTTSSGTLTFTSPTTAFWEGAHTGTLTY